MTPQEIITQARYITNDFDNSATYRQSDPELLTYVNEGLKEMAAFMPMMFSTAGDMTCEAGKAQQAVTFLDAVRLVDVVSIHDGPAITPMDRRVFDLFAPGWRQADPGPARHWAPLDNDPLNFFIYPPAPAGQVLDVRYVRNPGVYAINDEIGDVPEAMLPALADYVVYRAESKDDEHVLTGRAMAFYASFKSKIGVVENGPAS